VSVWYGVTQKKKNSVGGGGGGGGTGGDGGGGGGGNNGPKDKDFYATGGNVDFSDYLDADVYDLPQAVDDSDGRDII
jgi:hypothetical protein